LKRFSIGFTSPPRKVCYGDAQLSIWLRETVVEATGQTTSLPHVLFATRDVIAARSRRIL
jgi:hypothetical protein